MGATGSRAADVGWPSLSPWLTIRGEPEQLRRRDPCRRARQPTATNPATGSRILEIVGPDSAQPGSAR